MGKYTPWRIMAIAAGITLTGIEVYGAFEYLVKQEGHISYLVAGGAVVTATSALLHILAERQWRDGHKLQALLLWAALLPTLSLILSAAIERTGGAKDGTVQERQKIERRLELAKQAVSEAKDEVTSAEADVAAETKDGGCKSICRDLKAKAEAARKRLAEARNAPDLKLVVPRDPQAVRIAAIIPWVTEDQVVLYQPVILPITVSLLGILLLGAGLAEPKRKRRVKAKGKKKQAKRKRKPAKPKMPEPIRRKKHLALVASNEN